MCVGVSEPGDQDKSMHSQQQAKHVRLCSDLIEGLKKAPYRYYSQ